MKTLSIKSLILSLMTILFLGSGVYGQTKSTRNFQNDLETLTVRFVESVSKAYEKGDSYKQFEIKLVGKSNLKSIKPQGKALLMKAYIDLSNNSSTKTIKKNTRPMAEAIAASYKLNSKNENQGFELLMGGDQTVFWEDGLTSKACRWWQLRCHLSEIFGEQSADQLISAFVGWIISFF